MFYVFLLFCPYLSDDQTAEYSIGQENVPASDIPDVDGGIAGTGIGQGAFLLLEGRD